MTFYRQAGPAVRWQRQAPVVFEQGLIYSARARHGRSRGDPDAVQLLTHV
jgi:hypothetical protein